MNVAEHIQLRLVHEIHTSERKSFRGCRRRWDWIFRQNYYPIMTAKPLEFGVTYHRAMEEYYAPATWDWDREVVADVSILRFVEVCEEQRKKALEASGQTDLDAEVQKDYDERVLLGKGMLRYYFREVAPKLDVGFKPIRVEVPFMVPVPNPDKPEEGLWCKCAQCEVKWMTHRVKMAEIASHQTHSLQHAYSTSEWDQSQGLPVVYAGRIDMLAQDDAGHLWIFDWKTARAVTISGERDEFLALDDQVGSYVWALRACGLDVRGFIYHEQKKGFPQPPKQNVNRRLGRLFSVAQNQDTDYDTYVKHVMEFDHDAWEEGLYDEYLDFLRDFGTNFYSRHQIHKSAVECRQIEYGIGQEAMDMIDPSLRVYPSPGRFSCGFCAFRQPCLGVFQGEDYVYTLESLFEKREHYYLRQEASTESKGGE